MKKHREARLKFLPIEVALRLLSDLSRFDSVLSAAALVRSILPALVLSWHQSLSLIQRNKYETSKEDLVGARSSPSKSAKVGKKVLSRVHLKPPPNPCLS